MFFIYKMPACRKIIAKKVADKGNQQQRGCSLSRKWSHTRSRCKIDAVYFPKGTAPKCGAEVEAKSAAIVVQASSGRQRHRRHQSGEQEKPGIGVLPRCIFNLTMNDMLHYTDLANKTAEGDMLCSHLQLARRLIKHELGERHSQSIGNNHEYSIIQQWK